MCLLSLRWFKAFSCYEKCTARGKGAHLKFTVYKIELQTHQTSSKNNFQRNFKNNRLKCRNTIQTNQWKRTWLLSKFEFRKMVETVESMVTDVDDNFEMWVIDADRVFMLKKSPTSYNCYQPPMIFCNNQLNGWKGGYQTLSIIILVNQNISVSLL